MNRQENQADTAAGERSAAAPDSCRYSCAPAGVAAYFLVGPTAVGKSAVAQWIAERKGWSVLSADSMLVYRGMDIGTAKPSMEERRQVRYWGVDVTTPDRTFTVADFMEEARKCADRVGPGNPLLVVGGTGLYLRALMEGLEGAAASRPEVRDRWNQLLETGGVEALQRALLDRSAEWYESIVDKGNPRRLIRALERCEAGEGVPERRWSRFGAPLVAGMILPREQLQERVVARVHRMYEQGLLAEVQSLLKKHGELSRTAAQAIGYKEACECLSGTLTQLEAMERTVVRTRQFAKRQMTWFRGQMSVEWLPFYAGMKVELMADQLLAFWERTGAVPLAI